jgi:probable F420-dependent oxidoreductase
MEIGVRLPIEGAKVSPENIISVARRAEELGYHSVWVPDHVVLPAKVDSFYPYDNNRWPYPADAKILNPLLALAWAAAIAPSVKLGTSVLIEPLRNPVLLAKQVSTLDFLSGGRVILGLGVGWMKEEFDVIGQSFSNRGKRADEMTALMRALWTGETVDFQGEFYQVSGCKMHPPAIQPAIPVVWGGYSEAALKRVARVGDGWAPTKSTFDKLAEGIGKIRGYCRAYGRDPDNVFVIARPGPVYQINPEILARYRELDIRHVVVDPPLHGPDLSACYEEMERVAEVGGLQRRS